MRGGLPVTSRVRHPYERSHCLAHHLGGGMVGHLHCFTLATLRDCLLRRWTSARWFGRSWSPLRVAAESFALVLSGDLCVLADAARDRATHSCDDTGRAEVEIPRSRLPVQPPRVGELELSLTMPSGPSTRSTDDRPSTIASRSWTAVSAALFRASEQVLSPTFQR